MITDSGGTGPARKPDENLTERDRRSSRIGQRVFQPDVLSVSVTAVHTHTSSSILDKIALDNRTQAALYANDIDVARVAE